MSDVCVACCEMCGVVGGGLLCVWGPGRGGGMHVEQLAADGSTSPLTAPAYLFCLGFVPAHTLVNSRHTHTLMHVSTHMSTPVLHPHSHTRRQLLDEPRRFAVISVGQKLLVMLPTCAGQLVALCPKQLAMAEDFTSEVVKTIMAVSIWVCAGLGFYMRRITGFRLSENA